jgi:TRAP-type C4-dicarboxylate transport system substrate-binding protein
MASKSICFALGAALGALSSGAAAQTTLKLHHFLGPKAPAQTQMLEPWAQRVEKAAGGKV